MDGRGLGGSWTGLERAPERPEACTDALEPPHTHLRPGKDGSRVKFFFPDSQDVISPTFDFRTERHSPHRVRQRDDAYAHEALSDAPYDGILVSKAIVDG